MPATDDTLRTLLAGSRETLAAVGAILDTGVITKTSRSLKTVGPWCIGVLYRTDSVEVNLLVSALSSERPGYSTLPGRTTYHGVVGESTLLEGSCYRPIRPGFVVGVDPGTQHTIEPTEAGCQIIQVVALMLL